MLVNPQNTSPTLTSPEDITEHIQLFVGYIHLDVPQIQSHPIQSASSFPINLLFLFSVGDDHVRNIFICYFSLISHFLFIIRSCWLHHLDTSPILLLPSVPHSYYHLSPRLFQQLSNWSPDLPPSIFSLLIYSPLSQNELSQRQCDQVTVFP